MASIAGSPVSPSRTHWAEMSAVEIPKDRWASLGVLAFGTLVALASLAVHLF